MGEASTPGNVLYFLSAFGRLLREAGFRADIRAGREAAAAVLGG
jgi:aspartate aminotransferase-like enzyme